MRIKQRENLLNNLYCQLPPSGPIEDSVSSAIMTARNELEFLYKCENSFWAQRAKIKWRTKGERNTKYFHTIVNKRYNQNLILNLQKEDGSWTADSDEIRSLAFSHFNIIYNQTTLDPSCLQELWSFPIPELDQFDQTLL